MNAAVEMVQMSEQVRVTIEIYGGQTMTASGPADELRAAVAGRLLALGLAEGPSVVVQDAVTFYPRAVAALYRQGENHTTAEPVGRVTAVRESGNDDGDHRGEGS